MSSTSGGGEDKKKEDDKSRGARRRLPVVCKAIDRQLPGFEESGSSAKWRAPFYFIQAADTQLGLIANYGDGTIGDQYPNITWDREVELCKLSVKKINAMRPKPK